jgi:hypothetical protein
MDEGSEWIAACDSGGENNRFGACEAHHVGISPQENRRRSKSALGKVEGSEPEIGGSPPWGACFCPATENAETKNGSSGRIRIITQT